MTALALRQPLRPRPGSAGRSRLRPGRGARRRACRDALDAAGSATCRSAVKLLWDSPSVHGALRGHRHVCRATSPGSSGWSARRPGPAASTRDVRHDLPRASTASPRFPFDLDDRRRLRAGLRALAGDPAFGGLHPRAVAGTPGGADRDAGRAPAGPDSSPSRSSRAGAARSATWPSPTARAVRALQDRRSVVPQLAGPGLWRMRDQQISDFPLCNKSFNLPTAGTTFEGSRHHVLDDPQRRACSRAIARWPIRTEPPPAARPLPAGCPAIAAGEAARTAAAPASKPARRRRSRRRGRRARRLDLGKCLFCADCVEACPRARRSVLRADHRLAARARDGSDPRRRDMELAARAGARREDQARSSAARSSCAR